MTKMKVWDPFVRIFHWSLVGLFAANALFLDAETKLHRQIGYAIAILVILRVIWGFVGKGYARFSTFPPSFQNAIGQLTDIATGRKTIHLGHTPLGALMIYNLIGAIALISTSGYLMTTDMFWGVGWVEEFHEIAVTWAEVSVVLHIAAVVYESVRTKVNLPRAMITGIKIIPSALKPSDD
jgi:cytochrome b